MCIKLSNLDSMTGRDLIIKGGQGLSRENKGKLEI